MLMMWVTMWMGLLSLLYLVACVYLLKLVLDGETTLGEAFKVWIPLGACFGLCFATASTIVLPFVFGLAGLIYAGRLVWQQYAAGKDALRELDAQEETKWRAAIAQNDGNAYAHLSLGHALLGRRDFEGAVAEYRRAIALDTALARELNSFLAGRTDKEEQKVRSRLPDLKQMARSAPVPQEPWRGR